MGEININPDQLDIIYKEGLENYKEAVISFDEASTNAVKSLSFFNTPGLDKYLPSAVEMATRILQFTSEGPLFYTGFEAFGYKITSMAMYLKDIDKIEGLGNYPELERFFRAIIKDGLKYDDLKEFDKFVLGILNAAKEKYDKAMIDKEEWLRNFDNSIDEKTLIKQLKEAGYTDEEIESFLDSLPKDGNGNRVLEAGGIALVCLIAVFTRQSQTAPGVMADSYFFGTDSPLWLANTPLSKAIEAMATSVGAEGLSGIIGGGLAGVIIGTVIAFSDGEISPQEWLNEAGSAGIGGIVGAVALAALAGGGVAALPAAVIAAFLSWGVTVGASKFFNSIYEMPGGVPKDFENWSDEEKWKYIKETTGIDHEKLEVLRQAKESGNFTAEELASMGRCITDEDYVMDPNCDDPCAIAFYIYMTYGDGITDTDPMIRDNILQSEALRYVNGFDFDEIIKYLEMFEEVCG